MGGCKCTFDNCGISTATAKKLFPNRETHFFHFPIRDPDRCIQWAIYSNNMNFLELPLEKLKNKVICDLHFNENFFMNYKREKLNKTNAIPTIYLAADNSERDLLQNPTEWVEANKKKAVPSSFYQTVNINIDESTLTDSSSLDLAGPTQTKRKKLENPNPVKILNISAGNSEISSPTVQRVVKKLPTAQTARIQAQTPQRTQLIKVSGENYTIRQIPKSPPVSLPKVPKREAIQSPPNSPPPPPPQPPQTEVVFQEFSQEIPIVISEPTNSEPSENLKELLKEVAEIKEMLKEGKSQTAPVKSEESKISQSHMNKVQLFNGIKRYLSPSMNALLRIELFSTPNHIHLVINLIMSKTNNMNTVSGISKCSSAPSLVNSLTESKTESVTHSVAEAIKEPSARPSDSSRDSTRDSTIQPTARATAKRFKIDDEVDTISRSEWMKKVRNQEFVVHDALEPDFPRIFAKKIQEKQHDEPRDDHKDDHVVPDAFKDEFKREFKEELKPPSHASSTAESNTESKNELNLKRSDSKTSLATTVSGGFDSDSMSELDEDSIQDHHTSSPRSSPKTFISIEIAIDPNDQNFELTFVDKAKDKATDKPEDKK